MTVVICVSSDDIIAFGSDSRATIVSPEGSCCIGTINNNKIICENKVLLTCGRGYMAQTYVDEFNQLLKELHHQDNELLNKVSSLSDYFGRDFCRKKYQEAFRDFDLNPYLGFILAGIEDGKPKMYKINNINNFEPELGERNFISDCTDRHDGIAQYLLNRIFTQGIDLEGVDDLLYLVHFVISETIISNTSNTGFPINIGYIT